MEYKDNNTLKNFLANHKVGKQVYADGDGNIIKEEILYCYNGYTCCEDEMVGIWEHIQI